MPCCENIFRNLMTVIQSKYVNREEFNNAIIEIRKAYSANSLNTLKASEVNFSSLSYRCAYLYRHFTAIIILTRRMWVRFCDETYEVQELIDRINTYKTVNVCSLGGGPGTDLLGFYLFLKMKNIQNVKVSGAIFDKYVQWNDIFSPLVSLFCRKKSNKIYNLNYEFCDFFKVPADNNLLNKIKQADILSIVKFVSAVGYDRRETQERIENLFNYLKPNALVFFLDNNDVSYIDLMEEAAINTNLSLLAEFNKKGRSIPKGEKKAMDLNKLLYVCEPQKNPGVSACVWIKED